MLCNQESGVVLLCDLVMVVVVLVQVLVYCVQYGVVGGFVMLFVECFECIQFYQYYYVVLFGIVFGLVCGEQVFGFLVVDQFGYYVGVVQQCEVLLLLVYVQYDDGGDGYYYQQCYQCVVVQYVYVVQVLYCIDFGWVDVVFCGGLQLGELIEGVVFVVCVVDVVGFVCVL